MSNKLNTANHDRDAAGMTYVYPVISRRAGGVSVGINLNPNNACNWHCAYCQVPGLIRGVAPDIDLDLLRAELVAMLDDIIHGSFMQERVAEESRVLSDVAISGNGEPTSCAAFDAVVEVIVQVMQQFHLCVPLRLITNGSYVQKSHVQKGLALMAEHQGEVWIKVDSVTDEGIRRMNGITMHAARLSEQVESVARVCPTWIQTCFVVWDDQPPSAFEVASYIEFLQALKEAETPIQGVLLYGLARPSLQEESRHLNALDEGWMKLVASRIGQRGFEVKLSL